MLIGLIGVLIAIAFSGLVVAVLSESRAVQSLADPADPAGMARWASNAGASSAYQPPWGAGGRRSNAAALAPRPRAGNSDLWSAPARRD
jgi:hypothetical protein